MNFKLKPRNIFVGIFVSMLLILVILILFTAVGVISAIDSIAVSSINQTNNTAYAIVQGADFPVYAQSVLIYLGILVAASVVLLIEILKGIERPLGMFLSRRHQAQTSSDLVLMKRGISILAIFYILMFMLIYIVFPLFAIYNTFSAFSYYASFISHRPQETFLTYSFCKPYLESGTLNYSVEVSTGAANVLGVTLSNQTALSCMALNEAATTISSSFRYTTFYSLLLLTLFLIYVGIRSFTILVKKGL